MILGCTGHRPRGIGGFSTTARNVLVDLAMDYISKEKPTEVITGMALGWDIAVAEACCKCRVPFIAALPCPDQDMYWPASHRYHYGYLLTLAAEKVLVSSEYYEGCMQKRNEYIVDHSDKLLALWSGKKGGTYNCIQYAEQRKVPYDNLYDSWLLKVKPAKV